MKTRKHDNDVCCSTIGKSLRRFPVRIVMVVDHCKVGFRAGRELSNSASSPKILHPDTQAIFIFTSVASFNALTNSDTIQRVSRPFPSRAASRLFPEHTMYYFRFERNNSMNAMETRLTGIYAKTVPSSKCTPRSSLSKHRHGLPICVVTTMHGYWLCLRLANYWRNRAGVVHVNSRYPPRINFLNKNGGRNFQPFDSRPLRLNKTIMNGQRPTLDISNLFILCT
jgi:hypothetical protein